MVQHEIKRRSEQKNRYSGVSIFSSKIKCGECGNWYGSKVWHSTSKYRKTIYQCNHKFKNDKKCETPHLYEEEIKRAFISAVNKILDNRKEVIKNLELVHKMLSDSAELENSEKDLQAEIEVLIGMVQHCISENASTPQNQAQYQARYDSLVDKYETKKTELDELKNTISDRKARLEILKHFISTLKKQKNLITEFDDTLWSSLVDYITVFAKDDIRFTFKDGTEIKA